MFRTTRFTGSFALAAALSTGAAQAQLLPPLSPSATIGQIVISGSEATTTIRLGPLQLDVSLTFEQVVGLTPSSLGLSARLATPTEMLGRFGDPRIGLAAGLPLVVRIEPPATGGLSFSGVVAIDVHTHNLSFGVNCPLRLYKAPLGGTFVDVTESMGMGSYRARGSTGGFSEFLIVADLRPPAEAVESKLARLEALLDTHSTAIPPDLGEALGEQVAAVRSAWEAGNVLAAVAEVNTFSSAVQATAGNPLPNVWRSSRDIVNVAGELRAAAATLRFSLNLAGG
jgi:hypothetical protein